MNRREIREEVFTRLNVELSSPVYWTADDVNESINDGYEEISDASEWYERNAVIPLLSNRTYYDLRSTLNDGFLSPRRCFNNQTNRWLSAVHLRELDMHTYRRWEILTVTEPEKMFMRGLWWFGVFPKKGADAGTLKFYYSAIPPALLQDTDSPGFQNESHYGLVEYALFDLLIQDGEVAKAMTHFKQYQEYEAALALDINRRIQGDKVNRLKG